MKSIQEILLTEAIDEINQRDAKIAELQNLVDSNQSNIQGMQSAFDQQHAANVTMLNAKQDELDTANNEIASLNSAQTAMQSQIDSLTQQLSDANATIQRLQNP